MGRLTLALLAFLPLGCFMSLVSRPHGYNDVALAAYIAENEGRIDPEAYMNVEEIIRYHGYPAEQYDITTVDGYILTVQRIPHGKNDDVAPLPGARRQPVLVQHGLLGSSAVWVVNTPEENLAYLLAEAGYDVWLGNVRGNSYGRRHVSLSPSQKEFWDFSFDEMAHYDLSAMIDFVLNETGFEATLYVGHSMGTTMPLALLASQPQYNDKVLSVMAMGPVTTTVHMRSPLRYLVPYANDLAFVVELFGDYELLPNSRVIKFFSGTVCKWPTRVLCSDLLFLLAGYDPAQLNSTRLPVYLYHEPDGTSVQNILHFAQMATKDGFWYYDFGTEGNLRKYGQPELVRSCGYPAEEHVIETEDGYILEAHRIPSTDKGIPVLLVHGILCSSIIWTDNTVNLSLAYLLSDRGYDVWLANLRGNTYSRRHRTLDASQKAFWDFTLDEQAEHDVSATIDYVLKTTGHTSLLCVGHSMGAGEILALLSRQQEYQDKVKGIVALAPTTAVANVRSFLRTFVYFADTIKVALEFLGQHELLGSEFVARALDSGMCQERKKGNETRGFVLAPACKRILERVLGKDPDQFNETRTLIYLVHCSAGTSLKMMHHLAQLVRSKKFASYDYGSKATNTAKYDAVSPPDYDVSRVRVPVCLMWSDNDLLADPRDVKWLADRLPNVHLNYRVPYKRFTHPDFLFGMNARHVVYDQVVSSLDALWKLEKTTDED